MVSLFANRVRGLFYAGMMGMLVASATPAFANEPLSVAAQSRMVDSSDIVAAFETAESGRVPVIVEFTSPPTPAQSARMDPAAADAALTDAMHRAQDAILSRVLDLPDQAGIAVAMTAPELNIKRMDFIPMLAITADSALLERLAADPMVERIHLDRQNEPFLTTSLPLIGMPAAYTAGATGSGWTVAVLDTGGRRSHEFLNSRIVSAACYSTNSGSITSLCPGGVTSSTGIDSANDCDPATLGCSHGTHVAGTAAGFFNAPLAGNPSSGVARDARIISINVFSRGTSGLTAFNSDIISGLNRVYALRNTYDIAAVNLSLGVRYSFHTSPCDSDSLKPAVDLVRSAGIAPIFAAGNDGYNSGISSPACISTAIAVASSTSSDQRSSFSNWGTLVDVVAPGSNILSSYVQGSRNDYYNAISGTSMAAPHVAGAFTALRSAVPGASIEQILSALQSTGTPITVGSITRNRINVDLALAALRGSNPTTTALSGPASSAQGTSVTFSASVSATSGGTPTGSVTFRRGSISIGTVALSGGNASVTTSSLPVGAHQITASYGGSGTHSSSVSTALTHTVSGSGGPVNDNFADRITIPGPGTVTGSNVGATAEPGEPQHGSTSGTRNSVWWSYTPATSGQVTIDTAGSDFDTTLAVYTGNAVNALTLVEANDDAIGLQSRVQFNAQAGVSYAIAVAGWGTRTGNITLNVAGGGGGSTPTTTTLTGPTSAVYGEIVNFTATVSSGSGTPSGTVIFRRGTMTVATATLSGGTASAPIVLPAGSHTLTAEYGGSSVYAMSTSAPRGLTVSPARVDVTLSAPSGPVRPGARARLSATVSAVAPGGGTPTGTVAFRAGGETLGTATLSGGTATASIELPTGNLAVVARYQGSNNHRDGRSSIERVVVTAAMSDEMRVNRRTSFIQRRPAVASLRRGAVVVFEDQHTAGGPFGITARQLDRVGQPTGGMIEVARPQADTGRPHIAQLEGGPIVVVWQGRGSDGTDIFMRRFRATNGRPFGSAAEINGVSRGNQTAPRVAPLQDGGFVVVWQSQHIDGNRDGIAIRFFDGDGTPRGAQQTVNTTTRGHQRHPDVAVQSNGDVIVVWGGPMGSGYGAFAQRFSPDGAPLDGEIELGSSGPGLLPQAFVAALDNGNIAVAFESSDRPNRWGPISIAVQRMRQAGRLWGDAVRMERRINGGQRMPAIAGLRQMGLVTAWRAPDGGRQGIWIQAIGRDGSLVGTPEIANQTVPGNQREPAVARLGRGRNFVVAWTAPGGGPGEGPNIMVRRFIGP